MKFDLLIVVIFMTSCFQQRITANSGTSMICSPNNITTEPLSCSPGQWIQIKSEIFAKQSNNESCDMDLGQCNSVKTDIKGVCSGPSQINGCQEVVDVSSIRNEMPCFNNVVDVAVQIQYECIEDSDIINMCQGEKTSQYPVLYLVSPQFPNTGPQNTICHCDIQGEQISVLAIQVDILTKLPWGPSDQFSSVLTVENNNDILWQSGSSCKECSDLHLRNQDLIFWDRKNFINISVTYANYGLSQQTVWLQASGFGKSLKVTCKSSPLPQDRIITTTTVSSTKASTSTAETSTTKGEHSTMTESTILPTSRTSTSQDSTANGIVSGTHITQNFPTTKVISNIASSIKIDNTLSTSVSSPTKDSFGTADSTHSTIAPITTLSQVDSATSKDNTVSSTGYKISGPETKSESTTTVIILVVILITLIIIAVIVAIIVFRSRRKYTYNDKVGFKALFLSMYHNMKSKRTQENEAAKMDYHEGKFDSFNFADSQTSKNKSQN